MKRIYEDWNPTATSLELVGKAEEIIHEYYRAGYVLTLRQLYYQFVARDIIPNTERSYKNLGTVITKARMAGLISWHAIEDRNRGHYSDWYEEDEMAPINGLSAGIHFDRWARQDVYIEVWVEKEALGNVISRACRPLCLPHLSCKGYLSAAEAWRAGQRFMEKLQDGKSCVLIHLGDHDPSGIDMTRDNSDRVNLFADAAVNGAVDVRRIALNMDQVNRYNPPPNPAKVTDSRASGYISRFGRISWELDALEPSVIENLIQDTVEPYIDHDLWDDVEEEEKAMKARLDRVGDRWDEIQRIIS
ncbi:MAG: hypothetical protein AAFX93_00005 [Verrucomicrobiota bacterium]